MTFEFVNLERTPPEFNGWAHRGSARHNRAHEELESLQKEDKRLSEKFGGSSTEIDFYSGGDTDSRLNRWTLLVNDLIPAAIQVLGESENDPVDEEDKGK